MLEVDPALFAEAVEQAAMHLGPDARLGPFAEASPAPAAADAKGVDGQPLPRHAEAEHEDDAPQRLLVVHRRPPSLGP